MWIKPGQHGKSAWSSSGHHLSPPASGRPTIPGPFISARPPARRPTIKVRARWRTRGRTALERLSLGMTWTAL